MEFSSETNLVSSIKELHIELLDIKGNSKILEEVKLGFGIPDLVVGELSSFNYKETQSALSYVDICVYKLIEYNKTVTLDFILLSTKCHKRQINNSLGKLIDRNYILKNESNYELSHRYKLSYTKSIAIEAKLKNWKRALMQAYRYKWFADYSYVILDHAHVHSAIQNIDLFEKHNIGLVSVSTEGNYYSHYVPQKEIPIDPKMQIMLSESLIHS